MAEEDSPFPRFTRGDDGSFELYNGLVCLKGKTGADGVSVDGTGVFTASIREYARGSMWWSVASEVVNVRGDVRDGLGVMDVTFRGKTAAGAFEMVERFRLPEGSPFFLAEACSIVNRGERTLPVDMAFFRLMPRDREGVKVARGDDALEPPKEGQPTPIPPQLWRPWRASAWELPDGTCLGLVGPQRLDVDVSFWEKDKRFHPDACARFSRAEIKPGKSFDVPDRPFVAGAYCRGGLASWRKVCDFWRKTVQ